MITYNNNNNNNNDRNGSYLKWLNVINYDYDYIVIIITIMNAMYITQKCIISI